jgi:hypothetical protein
VKVPLVFGSPEAARQLQYDRHIAELEEFARSCAEYNYCIDACDLAPMPHLLRVAQELVKSGTWEYWKETHEDSDKFVTVTEEVYRPGEAIRERLARRDDIGSMGEG